jgi:hypothetical protein
MLISFKSKKNALQINHKRKICLNLEQKNWRGLSNFFLIYTSPKKTIFLSPLPPTLLSSYKLV